MTDAIPSFERPGGMLSRVDAHMVMYHDPRCIHAEQYRACRTNLTALNRERAPWAVVVTSSMKGEGKSVTVANLAACLAELAGTRVCLLDTDFRMPSLGSMFGVEKSQAGLSDLFRDRASLRDVLRPTVLPDLDLIVAGEEPPNPAEMLGGERVQNLLGALKQRYSWILFDTPPVNPYTDACLLASMANGAILVVRMEETPRELVQRSLQNIRSAGGRVIGTFLTGLSPGKDDTDRAGYYRVDAGDREVARQERARGASRRRAERSLRRQERAWARRQKSRERERARQTEPRI